MRPLTDIKFPVGNYQPMPTPRQKPLLFWFCVAKFAFAQKLPFRILRYQVWVLDDKLQKTTKTITTTTTTTTRKSNRMKNRRKKRQHTETYLIQNSLFRRTTCQKFTFHFTGFWAFILRQSSERKNSRFTLNGLFADLGEGRAHIVRKNSCLRTKSSFFQ